MSGGGVLRIVDRKKNIFKLSQGEYIAVEKLEQVFKRCNLLEELWVYGNSLESLLVAVVVPARKHLMEWAEAQGVKGGWRCAAQCSDDKEWGSAAQPCLLLRWVLGG